MYLITSKNNDVIIMWGEKLTYMENGYPLLVNENNAFVPDTINIYKNIIIPDDITISQYCYTQDQGFYKNPNWITPEEDYLLSNPMYQKGYDQAVLDLMEV